MKTQYQLEGAVIPFSWRRVVMTGRFYWPDLKKQVVWYPIVALVVSIIMYTIHGDNPLVITLIGNLGLVLSAMFVFAPLVLGVRDRRAVAAQLPVAPREQFVFLVLYFLVAVPAVVLGLEFLVKFVCLYLVPGATIFSLLDTARTVVNITPQPVNGLMWLPTAVTLWGIVGFRKNRTLKSALTTIALTVGYTIALVVYTLVYVLTHTDVKNNLAPDHSESAQQITDHLMYVGTVSGYVSIALTGVVLVMIYRTIRNYQS